jgi:sarcosine oxidase subunit beta
MADVVIVGGGISGVAAAYELALMQVDVTLVERFDLAAMASGWTLAGVRQSGRHPAELPLAKEAVSAWKNLDQELDATVEYVQKGNLRLAYNEQEASRLAVMVEEQTALGLDIQMLSENRAVRDIAPMVSEFVLAASFCPTDGHANPNLTVKALAEAAIRAGATLRMGECVREVITEKNKIRGVRTDQSTISAATVVLAAGMHTQNLLKPLGLSLPITPQVVTVVRSKPTKPLLSQVLGTATANFAGRQEASGRFRVTGGIHTWRGTLEIENNMPSIKPFLEDISAVIQRATQAIPVFGTLAIEDMWAGLIDMTPDGLPVIEASPEIDGLVIAAGFSGHGFALGPVIGQIIRDLVLKKSPNFPLKAFARARLDSLKRANIAELHG